MLYNFICAASFVLMLLLNVLLGKCKRAKTVIRIFSGVIFVYKCAHYIVQNLRGNLSIPVEISSISYFLVPVIVAFKIKRLYGAGSFFGIAAGIGYFAFYTLLGFTVAGSFTLTEILTGCFSHGYLLLAGLHLFKNNDFSPSEGPRIWATLFAMLAWALVFYDLETRGITFIYYIIKPQYLYIFDATALNVLLVFLYYCLLAAAFAFAVKCFFYCNARRRAKPAAPAA